MKEQAAKQEEHNLTKIIKGNFSAIAEMDLEGIKAFAEKMEYFKDEEIQNALMEQADKKPFANTDMVSALKKLQENEKNKTTGGKDVYDPLLNGILEGAKNIKPSNPEEWNVFRNVIFLMLCQQACDKKNKKRAKGYLERAAEIAIEKGIKLATGYSKDELAKKFADAINILLQTLQQHENGGELAVEIKSAAPATEAKGGGPKKETPWWVSISSSNEDEHSLPYSVVNSKTAFEEISQKHLSRSMVGFTTVFPAATSSGLAFLWTWGSDIVLFSTLPIIPTAVVAAFLLSTAFMAFTMFPKWTSKTKQKWLTAGGILLGLGAAVTLIFSPLGILAFATASTNIDANLIAPILTTVLSAMTMVLFRKSYKILGAAHFLQIQDASMRDVVANDSKEHSQASRVYSSFNSASFSHSFPPGSMFSSMERTDNPQRFSIDSTASNNSYASQGFSLFSSVANFFGGNKNPHLKHSNLTGTQELLAVTLLSENLPNNDN